MRKVQFQSDTAAETPAPRASRPAAIWKGFAAFLLGVTLGMSFIVFGQTALDGPGSQDSGLWDSPPALRR